MFHQEARSGYDAALCMYHDQALIPSKTLAFWEGVNVTLGLPIIRTSPDHGTRADDIAGTGQADMRWHDRCDPQGGVDSQRAWMTDCRRFARVIAAHGLTAEEIARTELSARSQPDAAHCARGGTTCGRDILRGWPRTRRIDARAAGGGRGQGRGRRARWAMHRGVAADCGGISGPA